MSKVCQGQAGLVLVLEASRLSRNSADFQRLVEFRQATSMLIADADGVYDLRDFNDQLLLGFKGTMSAVELHILAQRMQEAKKAAARRGELRLPVPVGLAYDLDGQVVMDPDQEVQEAVGGVFRAFEETWGHAARGQSLPGPPLPHPWPRLDQPGAMDAAAPKPGRDDLAQPGLRRGLRLGPHEDRTLHRRRR